MYENQMFGYTESPLISRRTILKNISQLANKMKLIVKEQKSKLRY